MTKITSLIIFNEYSKYYDLMYRDKDYEGEVEYITGLLNEQHLSNAKILEFGSGTGKHGRLLAAKGFFVTGVELSKKMVDIAEETERFKCSQGDITSVNLHNTFDCVLSLFHVVSYLTENEQITALFQNANMHLKKNGLFIFDIWYSPSVNFNKPEVRIKKMSDSTFDVIRIAEPNILPDLNQVDVNYSIFYKLKSEVSWQLTTETHSMRHFSTSEIADFASQSGFDLIKAEEFKTKSKPSKETWGVCYILKKSN
jgi:SAM-dependent methyltransferase